MRRRGRGGGGESPAGSGDGVPCRASPDGEGLPRQAGTTDGPPGFTLLELLVATVMLGVLAAIALPIYRGFRERAATSSLQSELRTLRNAQELHFVENDGYTDDLGVLDYEPGSDVEVELRAGSGEDVGWAGRLSHRNEDVRCAVFEGSAPPYDPATDEGTVACDGGG